MRRWTLVLDFFFLVLLDLEPALLVDEAEDLALEIPLELLDTGLELLPLVLVTLTAEPGTGRIRDFLYRDRVELVLGLDNRTIVIFTFYQNKAGSLDNDDVLSLQRIVSNWNDSRQGN